MCILSLPFSLFFSCFAVTFSSHSRITPIHHYFTNFLCHFSVFLIYLAFIYSSSLLFLPFKPVFSTSAFQISSIFFCLVIFHSPYYLYFGCLLRISLISPPLFLLSLSFLRLVSLLFFMRISLSVPSFSVLQLSKRSVRGTKNERARWSRPVP